MVLNNINKYLETVKFKVEGLFLIKRLTSRIGNNNNLKFQSSAKKITNSLTEID